MKKIVIISNLLIVLLSLGACAKYSLKGSGKARKSEPVRNFADPGGTNVDGGYNSKDGALVLRANPYNAAAGTMIMFTAECFDNKDVRLEWNFADGGTSADRNTSHVYNTPNTYRVTAVCTKSSGEVRSGELLITITPPASNWNPNTLGPCPQAPQNNGGCCECQCQCCCCC